MVKINYKKLLKEMIEKHPHEIDKIIKIINDAHNNNQYLSLDFDTIIKNNEWNAEEKEILLKSLGYSQQQIICYDEKNGKTYSLSAIKFSIEYDYIESFKALIRILDITNSSCYRHETYDSIIYTIEQIENYEKKAKYMNALLENINKDDFEELTKLNYFEYSYFNFININIITSIIETQNLELIKKYIDYIKDKNQLNIYFLNAVETGNIEIVKLFIDNGADVNYISDEVILGEFTPLKIAIKMNNFEMVKFLVQNGADVDLKFDIDNEEFIKHFNNPQVNIPDIDKWTKEKQKKANNPYTKEIKDLMFRRGSLPIEFGSKINYVESTYINNILKVHFIDQIIDFDIDKPTDKCLERMQIIDYLFDKTNNKNNLDFINLLTITFLANDKDKFNKYTKYIIDNNIEVDIKRLLNDCIIYNTQNLIDEFLEFVNIYCKTSYLEIYKIYLTKSCFSLSSELSKNLLNRISKEERIELPLMPLCKNLDQIKELETLGFDINQIDSNGNNILFKLLHNKSYQDFTDEDIKMFDYLLDKIDLLHKNKDGYNILSYALYLLPTYEEEKYVKANSTDCLTHYEEQLIKLINKISNYDISCNEISKVIIKKLNHEYACNLNMNIIYIYQLHKHLFNSLFEAGFNIKLSDEILEELINNLYNCNELKGKIDIEATKEYFFTKLDRNRQIQTLDIENIFKKFNFSILNNNLTFEEFSKNLVQFNKEINSLKLFYEKNICQKLYPQKYMEFAKKTYNTTYEDLDKYLLIIIISAIQKYGADKLNFILDLIPDYNIDFSVFNEDIGFSLDTYLDIIGTDDQREPIYDCKRKINTFENNNIKFTGGLMQYAILTDNLDMVKLLQRRGANLFFVIDDLDFTWNYVNSKAMETYISSFTEPIHSDLNNDEQEYLSNLLNKQITLQYEINNKAKSDD